MNQQQFRQRLELAGEAARLLATRYVSEPLPNDLCYTLDLYNDSRGRRGPPGTIKYLGGRFLKPDDLRTLKAARGGAAWG